MKLILKTDTYGFYVEIVNPLVANAFRKCLPLESCVMVSAERICFDIESIDVSLGSPSLHVEKGDVIWDYSNNHLCIYIESCDMVSHDIPVKGIKAGHTLASVGELRYLKGNSKISISLSDEENISDNKILSQNEIDDLVSGLLSKKD